MSSGELLKKNLGLDKFKYVYITRYLSASGSKKVLMIVYDHKVDMPITSHHFKSWPWGTQLFNGTDIFHNERDHLPWTPLIPIEDFNGEFRGALLITYDMGGNYFHDKQKYSKKFRESFKPFLEFTTLDDFKKNAISQRNKDWYKDRFKNGNTGSKMVKVSWNHENDTLLILFRTKPTYIGIENPHENNRIDKSIFKVYPNYGGGKGTEKTGKSYNLYVKFLDISKYIGTKKEFLEFSPKEQGQLILDVLKNAPVQLWANSMDWYWQGTWENLDLLDASIYPFVGTSGKGIWNSRHGNEDFHLSKHFVEVLDIIYNNYSLIAKYIREH